MLYVLIASVVIAIIIGLYSVSQEKNEEMCHYCGEDKLYVRFNGLGYVKYVCCRNCYYFDDPFNQTDKTHAENLRISRQRNEITQETYIKLRNKLTAKDRNKKTAARQNTIKQLQP